MPGSLRVWIPATLLLTACAAPAQDPPAAYSWQQPHAKVLPTGDLEWQPQPFQFQPGATVRYLDYEAGSDTAPGTKAQPWQHHPWDPRATGQAKAFGGPATYVFKRGVVYRGTLVADDNGTVNERIQLTSDPGWGTGEAVISGAERVTGWQLGASHQDIPEPDKVWHVDLDWLPRNVWLHGAGGQSSRIALARTPNWTVSDPDDIKSEWYEWDMPAKPFDAFTTNDKGQKLYQATDTQHITKSADYYQDAIVWSEYGWVMGIPYPTRVQVVDVAQHFLGFDGQFGGVDSYKLIRHNRYFLEDKPHYLDAPGEFWFERKGTGGTLYLRLPNDQDPNQADVEVGRWLNLIDAKAIDHLRVSGLSFRFTNVMWDLTAGPWVGDDVEPACIRLLGSGNDIQITNCRFVDVTRPVRLKTTANGVLDRIVIADNEVSRADHAAFEVADDGDWGVKFPTGTLRDVKILRNKLDHVGLRPSRFGQGHAVEIRCPETLEMAGNILDRMYGAGLFVFGGKQNNALVDRPMVRLLIHHNKVTDSLLNCNDYGGIETWQGGPAYVFNNISGNPGGYWHYSHKLNPTKPGAARFGHAYYLDGAFKNYHFNNIAWGKSSDPLSRLGNTSAFQEIHSYQNTFFNNTIHKFQIGSRRQAPVAGRNKMLGNVWQDIGIMVFRDADPAKTQPDGNAADAGPQKSSYAYETNAYRDNVFHQIADLGVFEETGRIWPTFEEYAKALAARQSMASDLGTMAQQPPLPKADEHDFRPAPNSAATDRGAVVFVPWSLKAVVGEWNFVMPGGQPEQILDEHWYMTPYFIDRADYHIRPMYPLQAVNVTSDDYVEGALEDWAPGALKLNGQNQYATLTNAALDQPFEYQAQYTQPGWATVTMPKAAVVGEVVTVTVTLSKPDPKLKLRADLHWGKKDGSYGGFNAYGGDAQPVAGAGPYTFRIRSADKPDIGSLNLTLWTTPTGDFGDAVDVARIPLAVVAKATTETQQVEAGGGQVDGPVSAKGADLKNPEVHASNFLIEYVFRAATGGGEVVLLQKMDRSGYALTLDEAGKPELAIAGGGQQAKVTGPQALNDGQWHHLIAEADRAAKSLTLYVDGKQVATAAGLGDVSLANDADLYLGGTPQGRCLAGAVDFARVALGTLAEARTTIEELHTWEFDGPAIRDFTGRKTQGKRDAGAIDG